MRRVRWAGFAVLCLVVAPVGSSASGTEQGTQATVRTDFDGDGFADLAVGAPFEDVGTIVDAGLVNVIYGTATGLSAAGDQAWTQDSPDIRDGAEMGDQFGYTLAAGDFNGDGYADLAVGVPFEEVGLVIDAGLINVIYGSSGGLSALGNQVWTQDSAGIEEIAEFQDAFGTTVASGDFNGDGFDDLVAGVPTEDVTPQLPDSGAVNVIYGSAVGLTATGDQVWTQDSSGVEDVSEAGDFFGLFISGEDFDGDGFADLATGVPFEDGPTTVDSGAANVLYGSAAGLSSTGDQVWTQDSTGINDLGEDGDSFGYALASGDFDGDGFVDLAATAPLEDVGATVDAGAANVLYGSAAGLASAGDQLWTQNTRGIRDTAEEGDQFGLYPGAGDYDGDGFADLAIGALAEDVGTVADAGGLNVLYGSAIGLTADGDQVWTQDSQGIRDTSEAQDFFGCWVGSADFDGDGFADIVVCAQNEDVVAVDDGAVNVIYGTSAGLTADGDQLWSQNSQGIADTGEDGDLFGWVAP